MDTSDVEEKAEEIIAEAEPPPEVYLHWAFLSPPPCSGIHSTVGWSGGVQGVCTEICPLRLMRACV